MDVSAIVISAVLGYSQYTDEQGPEPSPHIRIEVAFEEKPYYLWQQLERPTTRMLGQRLGETWIGGLGGGYKYDINENLYVLGEVGYNFVDEGANQSIQQETVFKELVNNHLSDNHPLPVKLTGPYDQTSYGTSWELDNGLSAAIGAGIQINEDVSIELRYRALYVEERIELFNPEIRGAGGAQGGWWQETRSRDFSAVQVHFKWTF